MNHEDDVDEFSPSNRRVFCTNLLLTSGGLVLATSNVNKLAAQDPMIAYPPMRIEGAETLLPGAGLYFNYPTRNDPAVLLRTNEGEYRAYSRRCSHAGCSVEYDGSSRCLKCPCHKGTFDGRMGYVMLGPPRRPLDEIVLQVRAGGALWAIGRTFGRNTQMIAQNLGGGD